jgi:hypothetical protein
MNEQDIIKEYGQCVWLVQDEDSMMPHLIYTSEQALWDAYPNAEWHMDDSDVKEFTTYGCHYYASPWPIHGVK